MHNHNILKLDEAGQPRKWISWQDAICHHAKGQVLWQLGDDEQEVVFRGGENRITGAMSVLTTSPIIAVRGESKADRSYKVPSLSNRELFARDHHMCAYCGKLFNDSQLTREHIVPTSRGGEDKWMNVVTACKRCNHKKDCKLLEEIGWQLLYVPYTPNYAEGLILEKRNVLACQMEYLKSFIPQHSRVWQKLH